MYIEKTTAAERMIIRDAADFPFVYVSRARRLLMRVLADYFENREQKQIDRTDAENLRDVLDAINDALYEAEVTYALTVGDEDALGVEPTLEGARRAALVRDVEHLRDKLGHKATEAYLDLSDEEALPILRGMAAGKGVPA